MKPILTVLLLLLTQALLAPPEFIHTRTEFTEPNPLQEIWESVCYVESQMNPNAVNHAERAYGIAQIREIRLLDYEMHTGIKYELTDMLDSATSRKIFMFYAEKNLPDGIEAIARRWNSGPNGMEIAQSEIYFEKVLSNINNQI